MSLKEDSQYDSSQVLPRVYDNDKGVLKVLPTDGENDLLINPDGSINVNSTGGGGCDLTQVEADLEAILVESVETNTTLDSILAESVESNTKLDTVITETQQANTTLQDILVEAQEANVTLDNIEAGLAGPTITAGTSDGTISGDVFINVNNVKNQILQAADTNAALTYADFGTVNQRITQIDYTSPTFPGIIASKVLTYVLDGTRYRRTNITWVVT